MYYKKTLIALTIVLGLLLTATAKANDCVENTQDWLRSDSMAAISIIEKTGHITIYVDNFNPAHTSNDTILRNLGFHGWDQHLSDSLVAKGCVSPVFIPLYHLEKVEGGFKLIPDTGFQTVDVSDIEFMWRHK